MTTEEMGTGAVPPVTIGVIGTGNMGSALVRGWSRSAVPGLRLLVWDKIPAAMQRVVDCGGVEIASSPAALVQEATIVLLVVKPKDAADALSAVAPLFRADHIVVSAMAGVELEQIRGMCGPGPVVFRAMPNLGVEAGAGTVAVAAEKNGPAEAQQRVLALFATLGLAALVPESMMDAVTAVSGTGPALLAIAVEGLEDGGVAAGLPRATARLFIRRAVLGAARALLSDTGAEEPTTELRQRLVPADDPLTAGVRVVDERGVRQAFRDAVETAAARSREMRGPSGGRA